MIITASGGTNMKAYAEVRNPVGSGVNLHINVFTISSSTAIVFNVNIILDSAVTEATTLSTTVASTNRVSPTSPEAQLRHVLAAALEPSEGTQVFTRRMSQIETLVSEEDGKFIIPPGKAFALWTQFTAGTTGVAFAFGWWEEPI